MNINIKKSPIADALDEEMALTINRRHLDWFKSVLSHRMTPEEIEDYFKSYPKFNPAQIQRIRVWIHKSNLMFQFDGMVLQLFDNGEPMEYFSFAPSAHVSGN